MTRPEGFTVVPKWDEDASTLDYFEERVKMWLDIAALIGTSKHSKSRQVMSQTCKAIVFCCSVVGSSADLSNVFRGRRKCHGNHMNGILLLKSTMKKGQNGWNEPPTAAVMTMNGTRPLMASCKLRRMMATRGLWKRQKRLSRQTRRTLFPR